MQGGIFLLILKMILGLGFCVLMLLIYAILLFFTSLSDEYMRVGVLIALFLGASFFGFLSCLNKKKSCFLYAGGCGLLYGSVVVLVNVLLAKSSICIAGIFLFVLGAFILGGFGGIFGGNIKV